VLLDIDHINRKPVFRLDTSEIIGDRRERHFADEVGVFVELLSG
jgi:hypothetical protein